MSRAFPIMAGIRGAARFGQLFLAAVAILAGFGLTVLPRHPRHRAIPVAVMLVLAVHLEALRAPIRYRAFEGIPPIFDSLRTSGRELVACFPFPQPREGFQNVDCMLASTRADLEEANPSRRWLMDSLWPRAGVGILGGAPKACKSWLALDLAVSVASGTPCLDTWPALDAGGVLVYMAEDAAPLIKPVSSACADTAIWIWPRCRSASSPPPPSGSTCHTTSGAWPRRDRPSRSAAPARPRPLCPTASHERKPRE